ncbi:hypothetical protein ONZ45_g6394 [Pleurotus djamor]|nr:hypothetical protein ONZ45_g6394 [Pleurotus djamor]
MWRVELALQRIVGVQPAFMRPPYGEFNGMVRAAAKIRGQHLALWDFDSGDTWGIPTQDMINRYDAIATEHPDTILTLNHDTQQQSAQVVLPYAIQRLQQAGYELVTLAECLGEEPYQWVGTPQVKDATWTC